VPVTHRSSGDGVLPAAVLRENGAAPGWTGWSSWALIDL
jgi:hypothetical protein